MMGDVPPHAFEGRSDQLRTEGVSWTDPIQGRPINLHSAPTLDGSHTTSVEDIVWHVVT